MARLRGGETEWNTVGSSDDLDQLGYRCARSCASHLDLSARCEAPIRDALEFPDPSGPFALDPILRDLASDVLGQEAWPVRALVFAKSAGANWSVPWHQDRVIAVRAREDVEGFAGWSIKGGVPHVSAPASVLDGMVALRVHLDPCPSAAGALEIVPGSHDQGVLCSEQRRELSCLPAVSCAAERGDVLIMRPLLLHRSRSQSSPASRRVLHIEYASRPLPWPLRWNDGPVVMPHSQPRE